MKRLPDFTITSAGIVSDAFLQRNIGTFYVAIEYVRQLPYGRNVDKLNPKAIFLDGCGTCSTKHSTLASLALENGIIDISLIIGVFAMNASNTPMIAATLDRYDVPYIPEAHTYVMFDGERFDYTKSQSSPADFIDDLLWEMEIHPDDIHVRKVNIHQDYMRKWLAENPSVAYNFEEIWDIREQCIHALSESV